MKKIKCLIAFLIWGAVMHAQDGHFTQFYNAPMFINPAAAGLGHSNLRIGNNYRSQWNPVQPISTMDVYLDKRQGNWGLGAMWAKNGAGNNSLQTNNLVLNAANHIPMNDGGFFSLGFQGGLYQKSFNPNDLVFENQYSLESHEIGTESGETFTTTKVSQFDMNGGLMFTQELNNLDISFGAAISHIFQGKQTFQDNDESVLPRKITASGMATVYLDSTLSIAPSVLFQKQGYAQATSLAIIASKQMAMGKSIQAGIGSRLKDAYIFYIGFGLNSVNIGLSYDINSSSLTRGTGGYGAFEMALAFVIDSDRQTRANNNSRPAPLLYSQRNVNPRMTDSDGDGVADESDHCPYAAGSAKNRGCPGKIDTDGDGLTDDVDMCPFMYGLPIQSGCPDTDGDGIADIDDSCPTVYGAMNLMGCPDSDRDGVSDKEDHCPTLFGLSQNHGCPDARTLVPTGNYGHYQYQYNNGVMTPNLNVPMQVYYPPNIPNPTLQQPVYPQTHSGQQQQGYPNSNQGNGYTRSYPQNNYEGNYSNAVVLDNFYVTFDKGSQNLTYEAKKQLRDYIVAMGLNADYKLLISGHTDADGSLNYNVELGRKRAEEVQTYLRQFGIDENRVMAISYGEQQPVSPNTTIDGMARNRRVEVMLIK
ncbi:MAG: type IX secretion system PorP/SprF family membrane protein [Flavobacteriales bacterium]|jgi:type IX secretion system PorP/SprF family membrane protein